MSFDLFAMQQQLLARLAPIANGITLRDTFSSVDLTDENAAAVEAQLAFLAFDPKQQVGHSAQHSVAWSFDVYVHTARANDAKKSVAAAVFSGALAQLVGWEFSPGLSLQIAPGQNSGISGSVLRISFGFTVPVYLAG